MCREVLNPLSWMKYLKPGREYEPIDLQNVVQDCARLLHTIQVKVAVLRKIDWCGSITGGLKSDCKGWRLCQRVCDSGMHSARVSL